MMIIIISIIISVGILQKIVRRNGIYTLCNVRGQDGMCTI